MFKKRCQSYKDIESISDIKKFDMIVNTTSVGLKANDNIPLNYDQVGSGIYPPFSIAEGWYYFGAIAVFIIICSII